MKNKIGNIVLILLGIGLVAYLFISSVMDLTNKNDMCTVTLDEAYGLVSIEHSINGLIPVGTDYYYLGVDDNNYNAYLIKAPKKWLESNFDINGQAAGGMQITGLVKKISDFQTSREIENRLMQLDGVALPYGANCINLDYKGRAILKLVAAVLAIVVVITGLIIYKDRDDVNRTYAKIWVVGLMVTLVLLLKAIM